MIGQLLDRRYLVTQRLSSGGFGETYLAQDTRIPGNPICVVKRLKPASNNPNQLQKAKQLFNREAEALAQLGNHNQIPRLLAYFTEAEEFYLVQEFVEGHTLEPEINPAQPWTEEQVIQLLQGVLPVLTFVHSCGVIHRDIKPANIMRRQQDGSLVLIDFGAIKQVQTPADGVDDYSLLSPATRIGTIGYMPSEQARGKPRPNSDLYALGMIVIQALTGVHPSQLEDDRQTGEVLWQHRVHINAALVEVLTKLTRYNFRERYQTATEALQALQNLNQPAVTPAIAASTPTHSPSPNPLQTVQELILEWVDAGILHSQTIHPNQPSRHPATIRIGRDPARCDIVLSDITVSGLHVELFFNGGDQQFYVRNLRETNPPLVNGEALPYGERPLFQGCVLQLGQVELRVSATAAKPYPMGEALHPNYSAAPEAGSVAATAKAPQPFIANAPPAVSPQFRQEAPRQNLPHVNYSPVQSPLQPPYPQVTPAPITQPKLDQPGWQFWLLWSIFTLVGCIIAGAAYRPENLMIVTGAGVLLGAMTGTGQWFLLRQWMTPTIGWIVASTVAATIAFLLIGIMPSLVVLLGVLIGVAQWWILKDKIRQAKLWILAKGAIDPISVAIGLALAESQFAEPNFVLVGGVAGVLSGVLTGAMMLWLLRQTLIDSRSQANS